jgi:hypothetical protein
MNFIDGLVSLRQLAEPRVSFIVLIACVLLVYLRAWSEETDQELTGRARLVVNAVTMSFVVALVLLTVVRFKVLK